MDPKRLSRNLTGIQAVQAWCYALNIVVVVDAVLLRCCSFSQLTKDRFLVEWENEIAPAIKAGKRVLIVAHGNTIRGLCQHLDEIDDEDITGLDIPTGEPCREFQA